MKPLLLFITLVGFAAVFGQEGKLKREYFCGPCGCKNDGKIFDQPGDCPLCQMKLQQVGTFHCNMISVSADGKLMAYKRFKPDNIGRIFYRDIAQPGMERLVGEGDMPQISPDKNYIVFESGNKIHLYSIQKDTIIDISPGLEGVQSPTWDPSGKVVFGAGRFPDISFYKLDIKDKKPEPFFVKQGMRYGSRFSPDGKKMAYRCVQKITDSTFKRGIAIYDVATGEEKYVTAIGEYPSWSPDGRQLSFHWPGEKYFSIYIANADGTGLKKIAEDKNGDCELPVWSVDGKKLFFQTNRRRGNWEIWTMNVDGSDQKPFIWDK